MYPLVRLQLLKMLNLHLFLFIRESVSLFYRKEGSFENVLMRKNDKKNEIVFIESA